MQDIIATPCYGWRQMENELALVRDLLGGTAAMRRAGAKWLPREDAESWQAWQARLNRSVLFNGLGRRADEIADGFRKAAKSAS